MIIQPARIVVIDNDEIHLKYLVDALTAMGSACLPFHYKEDHPESKLLSGARFIFCDLHLISDAMTSDRKQQYANIASMLLSCLDDDHGPYALVIWSEFPDEVDDLIAYLDELGPNQRPIKCSVLKKNDFIPTDSDSEPKGEELIAAIAGLFEDTPGLSALFKWEQKVSIAASVTTSTLWKLCEGADESKRDIALRNTLGKLAMGSSGEMLAKEHPGRGVVEALSPLLSDQLEKSDINEEFWKTAVDFDCPNEAAPVADLYAKLHFEYPTSHSPLERGTACCLPDNWKSDDGFKTKFGFSKEEVLGQFGYTGEKLTEAKDAARWYLIQLNAACDQAQNNPGLIPYVLGFIIPNEIKKSKGKLSTWSSRAFAMDESEQVLCCHGRFVIGVTKAEVKDFTVRLRIRTQLLDEMVRQIRMQSARLGVIEPL